MYWYSLHCLSALWLAGTGTLSSKGTFDWGVIKMVMWYYWGTISWSCDCVWGGGEEGGGGIAKKVILVVPVYLDLKLKAEY